MKSQQADLSEFAEVIRTRNRTLQAVPRQRLHDESSPQASLLHAMATRYMQQSCISSGGSSPFYSISASLAGFDRIESLSGRLRPQGVENTVAGVLHMEAAGNPLEHGHSDGREALRVGFLDSNADDMCAGLAIAEVSGEYAHRSLPADL